MGVLHELAGEVKAITSTVWSASGVSWAKAVAMKAETTRLRFSGMRQHVAHEVDPGPVEELKSERADIAVQTTKQVARL